MNRTQPIDQLTPQQIRRELATILARGVVRLVARRRRLEACGDSDAGKTGKSAAAGLEDS